jgi:hypothetical protein
MEFEIPHNLKEAVKDNKLVIFIGAGVSRSAGLPLWKDIVLKTLENPAILKGESYIRAIQDDILTPLEALDKIKITNIREVYKTFEHETAKKIKNDIYEKISNLTKRIVTTNYDTLIEYNTNIITLDTNSYYNLQKLDELNEFILKIHGTSSSIDNSVIFTSDYEDLYGESNSLARFQLEKLVSSYSCLFLGFSMNDNYVSKLFDKLNKLYKGLGKEHFIISTTNIDHDFLESINIPSHNDLPLYLDALSQFKKNETPANSDRNNEQNGVAKLEPEDNRLPEDGIKLQIGHDTPPIIEHWTGRSEELKSLMSPHKVCFITGIGGQGKSALASKVLTDSNKHELIFCDWRDFKEEDLNLQSKLYQLIELVSNGKTQTKQLIGFETETLVDIFFDQLGAQSGIFVFDNIDKYIDLQKFTPSGDMATFFNKSLKTTHNAKFIFTCRPFIHFAGIGFYQVQLEGLEFDDVKDLVRKYHNKLYETELHSISIKLHSATKGHPLWMGLILAQSRTDITQISSILDRISAHHSSETGHISSFISETILENVWSGLKEREKILLRTLSISNISESEEDLAKIISKKINYNQFSKALRALKALNLIVAKEGAGHIELHPLVREFIKINYGREEQESYIALYVSYLDGFIVLIKNKLGMVLGHEDIDVISKKIEILINTDKIQDSMNELRLTSESFQISGYCEEFLRLSDLLLKKNIWAHNKISSLHGFFDFINDFFTRMAEFGRFEMFDHYMEKYRKVFNEADANMILAKSSICHRLWCEGDYNKAIKEGRSASDLIDVLGESDSWSGKHRYNLALRDSNNVENINRALIFFCEGKKLDDLLDSECSLANNGQYGNVGRCLLLLERYEESLNLTVKSYQSLAGDKTNFFNLHNLGYAAKWIGEILELQGFALESLYFYTYAKNIWKNDMPGEANKLDLYVSQLPSTSSNQSITSLETWQITKFCNDWATAQHEKYLP